MGIEQLISYWKRSKVNVALMHRWIMRDEGSFAPVIPDSSFYQSRKFWPQFLAQFLTPIHSCSLAFVDLPPEMSLLKYRYKMVELYPTYSDV
jgi:hypothetical protein